MDSQGEPRKFIVDRGKVAAILDPDTVKIKYIRLFGGDDSPRNVGTMIEFMAAVSNWTERELGELTTKEVEALWDRVQVAIEDDAVDPTEAPSANTPSSPTATEKDTSSPDGAES